MVGDALLQGTGSVILAVYRPKIQLLKRQLDSIAAQTLTDWHCLVGIDGADPETAAAVRDLVAHDPRFEVREYERNLGVYRHFERMLTEVAPDTAWVALSDQDDYFGPNKFETLLTELDASGTSAIAGQARVVNEAGDLMTTTRRKQGNLADLLLHNQVTGATAILRYPVVKAALPFPPTSPHAIHDHWLAVVAAAQGGVTISNQVVQDYVQHGENLIGEATTGTTRKKFTRVFRAGPKLWLDEEVLSIWQWRRDMAAQLARNLGEDLPHIPCGAPGTGLSEVSSALRGSLQRRFLSPSDAFLLYLAAVAFMLFKRSARTT